MLIFRIILPLDVEIELER